MARFDDLTDRGPRAIAGAIARQIRAGELAPGDRLPTVRQVAVDLAINPNTVMRAYKELEIRAVLTTQQGTGTFISDTQPKRDQVERQRRLHQMVGELVARAGAEGYTLDEVMEVLRDLVAERPRDKVAQ